jgi:hypothetical protein
MLALLVIIDSGADGSANSVNAECETAQLRARCCLLYTTDATLQQRFLRAKQVLTLHNSDTFELVHNCSVA